MQVIDTTDLPKEMTWLVQDAVYNGKDCCITAECDPKLARKLTPQTESIYKFELALQKPALTMMLRGVNIDMDLRARMMGGLRHDINRLENWFDQLCVETCGHPVNHRSPAQLFELFYRDMALPVEHTVQKGERKPSTNRECLERLFDKHLYAKPLVKTILALRDAEKKYGVLKTCVDHTGRFRCSYNIGGTNTGRWSSSRSVFGYGSNYQNITEEIREAFIPDPGYVICYADLEQAESMVVAYESEDLNYLQACLSGDLHTQVTKYIWPDLKWANDNGPEDRKIAEQLYYRHFSHRYMSKRAGHASNYLISAWGLARALKLAIALVEEVQNKYFTIFPGIKRWHGEIQSQLQSSAYLVTPMGRVRIFFDRLLDDATLRKAIAFIPQSTVADILNLALYRVWKYLEPLGVELLGQVHDAIVFQVPENKLNLINKVNDMMRIPVRIKGRTMVIKSEIKYGMNWKDLEKYTD